MTKRKKPTKLDLEIRDYENRARQKAYRIRKKGGFNANALKPSQENKFGTGSQKAKYLRELKAFVSRSNKIVVQQNNVAIPASDLETFNRYLEARNKTVRRVREEIQKKSTKAGMSTAKEYNNQLEEIKRTQPFESYAELKGEIQKLKSFRRGKAKFNRDILAFKSSAIQDLNELGDNYSVDLADRIQDLSNTGFLWLYTYTDFKDSLNDYIYDSAMEAKGRYRYVRVGTREGRLKLLDLIDDAKRQFGNLDY